MIHSLSELDSVEGLAEALCGKSAAKVTASSDSADAAAALPNGTYTLSLPDGSHRTFRIHTRPERCKFAGGQRLLSILTKPANDEDESYLPFAFVEFGAVRVWKRYRGSQYDVGSQILLRVMTGGGRSGEAVQLAKTCLKCNRLLTTPESIARGFGPGCWERRAGR